MSPWIDDESSEEVGSAANATSRPSGGALATASRTVTDPSTSAAPPRLRRGHPMRSGHFVPAGEIIAVGLICFALWFFLDARQLYVNATTSPPGTRRSVAMSVLRPVVRVEDVFGFDRIVDGANRLLGRPSAAAPSGGSASQRPTPLPHRPTTVIGPPAPGAGNGSSTPGSGTLGPPAPGPHAVALPPLRQPTVAHPMSVLEIGDSLGVDLGDGLEEVLGDDKRVTLHTEAVIDTGLANVAYYNWPATLEKELTRYHPGLVVVFLGGNDAQSFDVGDKLAEFGSTYWRQQYGLRVATMMKEATATGAHVLWVGMPIMAPSSGLTPAMEALDSIYEAKASTTAGVHYLSTWKLLASPSGAFTTFLPDAAGNEVAVRDPDGVHIALPAGDDLVASAIVKAVKADFGITI